MMTRRLQSGFTLIELLVVIAIIGILSAVVLASLGTARQKGNDGAVQADLSTIKTQAELFDNSNGSSGYGTSGGSGACTGGMFADPTISNAVNGAKLDSKGSVVACNSITTAYAVQAQVNGTTTNTTYWCTDSLGNAKYDFSALSGATVCP